MAELTISIPEEVMKQAEKSGIDLSRLLAALVKREILKRQLFERSKSKEEQELIKWSVELGRKAKKGRFKRLLSELPSKRREELLGKLSPDKRRKILSE